MKTKIELASRELTYALPPASEVHAVSKRPEEVDLRPEAKGLKVGGFEPSEATGKTPDGKPIFTKGWHGNADAALKEAREPFVVLQVGYHQKPGANCSGSVTEAGRDVGFEEDVIGQVGNGYYWMAKSGLGGGTSCELVALDALPDVKDAHSSIQSVLLRVLRRLGMSR